MSVDELDDEKTQIIAPSVSLLSADNAPKARLAEMRVDSPDYKEYGDVVLENELQTIGRSSHADISIDSKSLSRVHARMFLASDGWHIVDEDSTNGIKINKKKVKSAQLKHGDLVQIGSLMYKFFIENQDEIAANEAGATDEEDIEKTMFIQPAARQSAMSSPAAVQNEFSMSPRPKQSKPEAVDVDSEEEDEGSIWPVIIAIVVVAGLILYLVEIFL